MASDSRNDLLKQLHKIDTILLGLVLVLKPSEDERDRSPGKESQKSVSLDRSLDKELENHVEFLKTVIEKAKVNGHSSILHEAEWYKERWEKLLADYSRHDLLSQPQRPAGEPYEGAKEALLQSLG